MLLVMKPPSGAGALLRKDRLQEKRATKATLSSLLLRIRRVLTGSNKPGSSTEIPEHSCWSHRGRIRSEAAFARLAGCAPIPASSGQTTRYRLDRSGDRRLNRALHMILVIRRRAPADDRLRRATHA